MNPGKYLKAVEEQEKEGQERLGTTNLYNRSLLMVSKTPKTNLMVVLLSFWLCANVRSSAVATKP